MISDDDIKMCAEALVMMFGTDAPLRCAARAEEYSAKNEKDGYEFWRRMVKATERLLQAEPEQGQPNS